MVWDRDHKSDGKGSPLEPPGGASPAFTFGSVKPDSQFWASRTVRELICCFVLSHPVCGNLFQQPEETKTICKSKKTKYILNTYNVHTEIFGRNN